MKHDVLNRSISMSNVDVYLDSGWIPTSKGVIQIVDLENVGILGMFRLTEALE